MMINLWMLSFEQQIVWAFILLEAGVITFLVIASYAAKVYVPFYKAWERKKIALIKAYLQDPTSDSKPPYLHSINLWLSELKQTTFMTEQTKSTFVQRYSIDRVRPFIKSRNFIKRYQLIEAYRYFITADDKNSLITLINDERYIISINAMGISSLLDDAAIYHAIIEKLAELNRGMQTLHINQLRETPILIDVLVDYLVHSNDIRLKTLCYHIAQVLKPNEKFYHLALSDVDHVEGDYRLAAIRVLAHSDPQKAKTKLFQLLKNNDWLVRNSVIQGLNEIDLPWSLDELAKCLNDEAYWVRVSAAKSLSRHGDEGRLLLTEYQNSEEARYQSMATYFLDIHAMKDQL